MKLAILGYGVEGKSVEKYFKTHPYDNVPPEDIEIKIFDDFKDEDIDGFELEDYDVIFRTPSVRPHYDFKKYEKETEYAAEKPHWTSATKYFFAHCPAEIISVTGTKGKGTTCSMIAAILENVNEKLYGKSAPKTYLVGNIGNPCLDVLDKIEPEDNVVFELSSFQLWDLHIGSYIGVILRIEPDHLNVHKDYEDYVYAKSAVSRYKEPTDHLIYFSENETTKGLAEKSKAKKHAYPLLQTKTDNTEKLSEKNEAKLKEILDSLSLPGTHNQENAEAALLAVAARICNGSLNDFLESDALYESAKSALKNFKGLPHRLEFVRELNGVKYYDDNFSSAFPATDVAIAAFEENPTVLIAGGKDRGLDLTNFKNRLKSAKNLKKIILIGEIAKNLASAGSSDSSTANPKFEIAPNLETAVKLAKTAAEAEFAKKSAIIVMSPGAASFDMFENFKDRGEKFQKIVKELK
ncbi:UDP-N-acetylmuramoyl-L-alanine--D-glutamate ligase [Candidatus Saccharibacteria bacterium]|nr:UDP-N-acetylmuramoyl-L-alanine--D-glutamate ligase [Candidatus Saccharibacteria bacterium]MBQ3306251.1 UDP-N-acetylmuramoyl-L-alanine--D-glutamate ligase [Candidatus Saccharibacteria bacterium]